MTLANGFGYFGFDYPFCGVVNWLICGRRARLSLPAACVASVLLRGASVAPGAAAGGGTAGKGPQKGKTPGGKPGNMPGATREETEQKGSLPTLENGPNM